MNSDEFQHREQEQNDTIDQVSITSDEEVTQDESAPQSSLETLTFNTVNREEAQFEPSLNLDPEPLAQSQPQPIVQSSSVPDLQRQIQQLQQEVTQLQATKAQLQQEQKALTDKLGQFISEALSELEQSKQSLQIEVEKLERRRERVQKEMRTTFAGVSQDLAIRVQGFKEYLVGSLQDLAVTAEQLELLPETPEPLPQQPSATFSKPQENSQTPPTPQFTEQGFQEQTKLIRRLIDQYRNSPDYYGPPWQLRRTFEPIHAKRVSNWFFTQGGRGALRTMGSRLQNILIASATISILRSLYNNRVRTLVLANSPERLGEWRRGLQDCLGVDRRDFGPEQGIVLFEEAETLTQKADRLVQEGRLPLIIIDDMEDKISLSLLQFPLWLAFAPEPQQSQSNLIEKF